MYACRLANSVALTVEVLSRPTVESNTIVLYCLSVLISRNGLVVSETPAGVWRPGLPLMFGSQMSTSKPFCWPSCWIIHSKSTIASCRKAPLGPERPVTRILYFGLGMETGMIGLLNTRIACTSGSAAPTVTPVPVVSTALPLSWSISAEPDDESTGVAAAAVTNCCRLAIAPAVSAGVALALAVASASSPLSSVALVAEMTGRGLETVAPLACGSVSGAVRVTVMAAVVAPAGWSLASGAVSTTLGAVVAVGYGEMCFAT